MPLLGVPSTARSCHPLAAERAPCCSQRFPCKSVDLTALSRVSLNPSLTAKKGRKEGTWGWIWPRARRPPRSSCRAVVAAACRLRTSRVARSCCFYPKAEFLSQGRHPGCTREAIDFSRLQRRIPEGWRRPFGVSADAVAAQDKFKTKHDLTHRARLRSDPQDARGLSSLEQKVDVRQDLHGGHPGDLPDRRRPPDRPHLAQGQGRWACHRGAGCR